MSGATSEIRYLYESMQVFAEISCWDLVEWLAKRAAPLLRAIDRGAQGNADRPFAPGGERLRAGSVMGRGDTVRARGAFGGRGRVLEAYRQAVEARYRFYSYGDAMLIV